MENGDLILTAEQKTALEKLGVVLCYVHGSVASGQARDDSDLDVAVLFDRTPEDAVQATAAVVSALQGFVSGRELDVAILNTASPLLAQSVAARGTLLFARSPADDFRFQIHAMHEYESSRRIVHIGQKAAVARAHV